MQAISTWILLIGFGNDFDEPISNYYIDLPIDNSNFMSRRQDKQVYYNKIMRGILLKNIFSTTSD